jgi:hypothetical protein
MGSQTYACMYQSLTSDLVAFAAAMGGLLFGYEIGVVGQVLGMPSFKIFFNMVIDSELADSADFVLQKGPNFQSMVKFMSSFDRTNLLLLYFLPVVLLEPLYPPSYATNMVAKSRLLWVHFSFLLVPFSKPLPAMNLYTFLVVCFPEFL